MKHADVIAAADAYLEKNWSTMVDDVAKLCSIASFAEPDLAEPGAPFGPGPKAALTEALSIAQRMRFETADHEGYVGTVDLPGKEDAYIGIMGHVDVVPAGEGWHFQPYDVSLKDDHLVGRGVLDDKGPSLMALHAMKCLGDALVHAGVPLRYPIRFIFGTNEESGMEDASYYCAHNPEPAFLFTPDARFPICYGEKGIYQGTITSIAFANEPALLSLEAGIAVNAVPGKATARVRTTNGKLPSTEAVSVSWESGDTVLVRASGRTAHSSRPSDGVNAIGVLVDYLLSHDLCNQEERAFLAFQQKLATSLDGSAVGLACSDADFGPLTLCASMATMRGGRIRQSVDVRFPAGMEAAEVEATLKEQLAPLGASMDSILKMEPYLMGADDPAVKALLRAYRETTGRKDAPYTSGGASYARRFKRAAAFGAELPGAVRPEWAGHMHGPDEAASLEALRSAFRTYVLGLYELEQLRPEDLGPEQAS